MLLESIGARLRARRVERGLTQAALAEAAGVSPRFLVQLEKGTGNISVQRLAGVCAALALPLEQLAGLGPGGQDKVALVGLRGAGKSTIGAALGAHLSRRFVELDALAEDAAGMSSGRSSSCAGGGLPGDRGRARRPPSGGGPGHRDREHRHRAGDLAAAAAARPYRSLQASPGSHSSG